MVGLMVDNSIALGVRPPAPLEFNPLQAMLIASQLRRDDNQNALAQTQLRSADSQNALTQLQIGEKTTQANALADYRTKVTAGDPKADDALAGTPDLMKSVVEARAKLKDDQRK